MNSLQEASDGGILNAGATYRAVGQGFRKSFALKLDALGTELWNFHFDQDIGESFGQSLLELSNSDLLLFGLQEAAIPAVPEARPFVARLSSAGALLWARAYDIGMPGIGITFNQGV